MGRAAKSARPAKPAASTATKTEIGLITWACPFSLETKDKSNERPEYPYPPQGV